MSVQIHVNVHLSQGHDYSKMQQIDYVVKLYKRSFHKQKAFSFSWSLIKRKYDLHGLSVRSSGEYCWLPQTKYAHNYAYEYNVYDYMMFSLRVLLQVI